MLSRLIFKKKTLLYKKRKYQRPLLVGGRVRGQANRGQSLPEGGRGQGRHQEDWVPVRLDTDGLPHDGQPFPQPQEPRRHNVRGRMYILMFSVLVPRTTR